MQSRELATPVTRSRGRMSKCSRNAERSEKAPSARIPLEHVSVSETFYRARIILSPPPLWFFPGAHRVSEARRQCERYFLFRVDAGALPRPFPDIKNLVYQTQFLLAFELKDISADLLEAHRTIKEVLISQRMC